MRCYRDLPRAPSVMEIIRDDVLLFLLLPEEQSSGQLHRLQKQPEQQDQSVTPAPIDKAPNLERASVTIQ